MEEDDKTIDEILQKMGYVLEKNPRSGYNILMHEKGENIDYYVYIAQVMKKSDLIHWSRNKEIAFLTQRGIEIIEYGGWKKYVKRGTFTRLWEAVSSGGTIRGVLMGLVTVLVIWLIAYFFF